METPSLFVIYIGGRTEQSLIELHDIRFVVAHKLEDTYGELKKTWWGVPESLHLDCWGVLEAADGYRVQVVPRGSGVSTGSSLYFVNLGGYSRDEFTELHKNVFLVAQTEKDAKARALAMVREWQQGHKDHLYDVDSVKNVSALISSQWGLQLHPMSETPEFRFEFGYNPIGRKN